MRLCVAGSGCGRRWRGHSTPCWRSRSSRRRRRSTSCASTGRGSRRSALECRHGSNHPRTRATRTGVVAVTGADERKNTRRLIDAWGRLPVDLRRRHRLSVVAEVPPSVREQWLQWAVDARVCRHRGVHRRYRRRADGASAADGGAVGDAVDRRRIRPAGRRGGGLRVSGDLLRRLVATGGDRRAGGAVRSDGSVGDRNRDRTRPDRHRSPSGPAGGVGPRRYQVALAGRRPRVGVGARPHPAPNRDRAATPVRASRLSGRTTQ